MKATQPGLPRLRARRLQPPPEPEAPAATAGPPGPATPGAAAGVLASDPHGAEAEAAPARRPRLVLTGERARRRHLVIVDGREVWLPSTLFALLCTLAHARFATCTGFAQASAVTVCRLRTLLDAAKERGCGRSLIETGDGEEYRLAIDAGELGVDSGFAEINGGLISDEERAALLGLEVVER